MRASKRDYERFAMMVQALEKDYYKRKAWAYEIANILQPSNPRFDRGKFIDACLDGEYADSDSWKAMYPVKEKT